jgi:polar amino acid transport system permease protein
LSSLAWGYIWLFRSLPLIVVLIILYNFSYLYDTLSLGVPFTGITWGSFETINVLGQFSTAVVGLTLVQSAYTAEIIRGGFLGVDHGQYEAAAALGLPAWRRTLRIILPQALRTILLGSTKSSASPRARRWFTCWRCRSCSTPSR